MKIRVFVSYSHQDKGYLEEDSLLGYLKGLEDDGVEFWSDEALRGGDDWDAEIKDRISQTNIALVLVSQMFLNSSYCKNVEIAGFLEQCRKSGLVIFPIILSACEWQRHEWLKSKQYLPSGKKTIEEHYTNSGKRKSLFLEILEDLRAQIESIRQKQSANLSATPSGLQAAPLDRTETTESDSPAKSASSNSPTTTIEVTAGVVTTPFEGGTAKADPAIREDGLRGELAKWVDKLLAVQDQEVGGFDASLFEPSGSTNIWTTAQCLAGILSTNEGVARGADARRAFEYLQKVQKGDGGWAYSETRDDTVTDIASWVTVAYAGSVEAGIWKSFEDEGASASGVSPALQHILTRKCADGGWCPTGQVVPRNTRTYTTTMALWSLFRARNTPTLSIGKSLDKDMTAAIRWLLEQRRDDLGWVPNPNRTHQKDKHQGLNAQVLFILMQLESGFQFLRNVPVYKNAKREFLADERWRAYDFFQNTSIREADQGLEGSEYGIEGSTFLWCPWSLAALHALSTDSELSDEEREQAVRLRSELITKIQECSEDIGTSGTWELAETLFCVAYALK